MTLLRFTDIFKALLLRRSAALLLLLTVLFSFCSCSTNVDLSDVAQAADILPFVSGEEEEEAIENSENNTLNIRASETDIGMIVREIYAEDVCKGILVANDKDLEEVFLIAPEKIMEYRILYTEGTYGVQDLCVIKPADGCKDEILESLRQRKDSRTSFFEHYDVNDAYDIMQHAEIYTQGEYIIYLAVEDMETAKLIVDKYIPY